MSTDTKEQQALKAIAKAERQQRQVILGITNKLKSQFSFGNIKIWRDCYHITGYDDAYILANFAQEQCDKPIDIVQLRAWCTKLSDDLENKLKERKYETENKSNVPAPVANSDTNKGNKAPLVETVIQPSTPSQAAPIPHFQSSQAVSSLDESGFNNSNDYGLWPSPKEKAYLFWFQKRATKDVLDKIL